MISQKLVKGVLDKPICPLEKEQQEWIQRQNGHETPCAGYVDLIWCYEQTPRRVYGPTRFIVSSVYDPPFDAVLGRTDIATY